MMILALARNYIPSYGWVVRGGWNIADSVERSYDLEGMNVPLPQDASGLPRCAGSSHLVSSLGCGTDN